MTIKTYATFAGAKRAAPNGPIIRILDDPRDIFVVGIGANTTIMAVDPKSGYTDGSVEITTLMAGFKG